MIEDTDSADTVFPAYQVNVAAQVLAEQQQFNRSQGWKSLKGQWDNIDELIVLGGGPSLNTYLYQLQEALDRKVPVVTVNGSYHWAMNHHIFPSIQIVMDAREHNARFTRPVYPGTYFFIADSCHPDVLKGLPKGRTFLWDRNTVNSGSTVMLCGITLLRSLGMSKCHILGLDSCVSEHHHAYRQPENDNDKIIEFDIDGKMFKATQWMVSQAEEVLDLHKTWGDFKVYGDGMIAWMMNNKD